jgi:hypothetical protein
VTHLQVLPHGLALLFGASTTSHAAFTRGLALLHLVGLGLAIWGVGAALWRFPRLSLVDQLLVSAVLINLLAYTFLTPGALPYSARDYSAVLPLAAALAGRMAGRWLLSARLAPDTTGRAWYPGMSGPWMGTREEGPVAVAGFPARGVMHKYCERHGRCSLQRRKRDLGRGAGWQTGECWESCWRAVRGGGWRR